MSNATPSSPFVVVTVSGGTVMDARASGRITVIVEDWDCTDQAAPAMFDLEATPLTEAEVQYFLRRFNLSNEQGA